MAFWKRRNSDQAVDSPAEGWLVRVATSGKSGCVLYRWQAPGEVRLVKIFTGRTAAARRDRAVAALRLWRDEGYPVPGLYLTQAPGVARPHLVRQFVPGPTLQAHLRDRNIAEPQKLLAVEAALLQMRARHERALAERDSRWIHPDANTGNIIWAESGPVWIDIETLLVGVDPLEAASAELAKFARRALEDLGRSHLGTVARRAVSLYCGLERVPRLFCERTLLRRMQPIHRWRDRRRGAASPHTPTKYDLADLWQKTLSARDDAA